MNTNLKIVFEARLMTFADEGDGVPMRMRFPDGTEKDFKVTDNKVGEVIANVAMEWVKLQNAETRERWIGALRDAPCGTINQLFRVLLQNQAQEEKTGKWPWKH